MEKPLSPALALERVIGCTSRHNAALSAHTTSGEVAYAAGCIVVLYHPKRNRQTRYFRAAKPISSLAFSPDGIYLAVGERGLKPSTIIWDLRSGHVHAELRGHKHGVGCIAWSPRGHTLVTVGFRQDKQVLVWSLDASLGRERVDTLGANKATVKGNGSLVARGKVAQKVLACEFLPVGRQFVTCGEKHVKWWATPASVLDVVPGYTGPSSHEGVADLRGKPASIVESQRGATFTDVACGLGGSVFAVTSMGTLCAFDAATAAIRCFVSLEAVGAYSLTLQPPDPAHESSIDPPNNTTSARSPDLPHADSPPAPSPRPLLLAVGCSSGLVRLFETPTLRFVVTLPQPPPVGHLNFNSVDDITTLIESRASASQASKGAERAPTLRFPACTAVRWLCKPAHVTPAIDPATNMVASSEEAAVGAFPPPPPPERGPASHLVAIYGDRSIFVWDIAVTHHQAPGAAKSGADQAASQAQPLRSGIVSSPEQPPPPLPAPPPTVVVGKYRSFLHHSACIWDLRPLPCQQRNSEGSGEGDGQGSGSVTGFVTCSADNTVRVWSFDHSHHGHHHHHHHHHHHTPPRSAVATKSRAASPPNFFSRELVHSFTLDGLKRDASSPDSRNDGPNCSQGDDDMGGSVVVDNLPDLESPAAAAGAGGGLVSQELEERWRQRCPRALAVSPDGADLACGQRNGNLRVWSLTGAVPTKQGEQLPSSGSRTRFAEMYSAAAHDSEILSLDYTDCDPLTSLPSPSTKSLLPEMPTSLPLSPTSASVPSSSGLEVLLASAGRDRLIHVLGGCRSAEAQCGPSSNDKENSPSPLDHGAAKEGGDGKSQLISHPEVPLREYGLVQTLEQHRGAAVTALRFSPDGRRLFSCGGDARLSVSRVTATPCDPVPATATQDLALPEEALPRCSQVRLRPISRGGGASGNAGDGLVSMQEHGGVAYDIAADASGKYVVVPGTLDGQVHIYSARTGKHVRCYGHPDEHEAAASQPGAGLKRGRGRELYKCDTCPAGLLVASCSFDRWIKVRDFYSGETVASVSGHAELVTALRFSSDGKRLLSAGGDGCIFVWKLGSSLTGAMAERLGELQAQREKRRQQQQLQLQQSIQREQVRPETNGEEGEVATISRSERRRLARSLREDASTSPEQQEQQHSQEEQELANPVEASADSSGAAAPGSPGSGGSRQGPATDAAAAAADGVGSSAGAGSSPRLHGKWAAAVRESGGSYNVLGKYEITPGAERGGGGSSASPGEGQRTLAPHNGDSQSTSGSDPASSKPSEQSSSQPQDSGSCRSGEGSGSAEQDADEVDGPPELTRTQKFPTFDDDEESEDAGASEARGNGPFSVHGKVPRSDETQESGGHGGESGRRPSIGSGGDRASGTDENSLGDSQLVRSLEEEDGVRMAESPHSSGARGGADDFGGKQGNGAGNLRRGAERELSETEDEGDEDEEDWGERTMDGTVQLQVDARGGGGKASGGGKEGLSDAGGEPPSVEKAPNEEEEEEEDDDDLASTWLGDQVRSSIHLAVGNVGDAGDGGGSGGELGSPKHDPDIPAPEPSSGPSPTAKSPASSTSAGSPSALPPVDRLSFSTSFRRGALMPDNDNRVAEPATTPKAADTPGQDHTSEVEPSIRSNPPPTEALPNLVRSPQEPLTVETNLPSSSRAGGEGESSDSGTPVLLGGASEAVSGEALFSSPARRRPPSASSSAHSGSEAVASSLVGPPAHAGGGFSTPSKRKGGREHSAAGGGVAKPASGAGAHHGGGALVGLSRGSVSSVSSVATHGSSSSSRSLAEERERLRSRDRRRDTAFALQSMNEQLRSMGILSAAGVGTPTSTPGGGGGGGPDANPSPHTLEHHVSPHSTSSHEPATTAPSSSRTNSSSVQEKPQATPEAEVASGYVSSPAESFDRSEVTGSRDSGRDSHEVVGHAPEGGSEDKPPIKSREGPVDAASNAPDDTSGVGGDGVDVGSEVAGSGEPNEGEGTVADRGSLVESSLGDASAMLLAESSFIYAGHDDEDGGGGGGSGGGGGGGSGDPPLPLSASSVVGGADARRHSESGNGLSKLPRPVEEYRRSLVKLQAAALEAQRLYAELVHSFPSASVSASSSAAGELPSSSSAVAAETPFPHSPQWPANSYSGAPFASMRSSASSSFAGHSLGEEPPRDGQQLLEEFELTWRGLNNMAVTATQQFGMAGRNSTVRGSNASAASNRSFASEGTGGWAAAAGVRASGQGAGGISSVGSSFASDSFVSGSFSSLGAAGGLWNLNHQQSEHQRVPTQQQQQQRMLSPNSKSAEGAVAGCGELGASVGAPSTVAAGVVGEVASLRGLTPILERGESDINAEALKSVGLSTSRSTSGEGAALSPISPASSSLPVPYEHDDDEEDREGDGDQHQDDFGSSEVGGEGGCSGGSSTPPSRPAPPPPAAGSLGTPPFDGAFADDRVHSVGSAAPQLQTADATQANKSSGLLADAGIENPEVSQLLERYSDVLLGMVQQKLLASSSPASPTAMDRGL